MGVLLRGVSMRMLMDDGRTLPTEVSLDSELTHLVLQVPHAQHPVALASIESVNRSTDVQDCFVAVSPHVLEDRCTTLIIHGGQFLTFVFESVPVREYFETCVEFFVLAQASTNGML